MQAALKHNPSLANALAVVVGAGASGEAAARLLRQKGARVRLLERNPDKVGPSLLLLASELGIEIITGPHEPHHFQGASLVVPSPGVPFATLLPLVDAAGNPPIVGELELAYRYVAEPILAVTGTSGKTTTVSLAASMLREAGKTVFLGGNIGTPLADYVTGNVPGSLPGKGAGGKRADVLVLEVSSFQLMGCDTFTPAVGVLLNISPNHLDQHRSMGEYEEAKFSMFTRQSADNLAIFDSELAGEVARHAIKSRTEYFSDPETPWETRLLGAHNQRNIEAAYRACRAFGVSAETARKAAAAFEPLPNRLELVGDWNNVAYINDSKCTTVSALEVALKSMDRPTFLLAGGVFKGGDLGSLRPLLEEKVKAIGLFGQSRNEFTRAWQGIAPISWAATLEEAMRTVRGLAEEGDAILLAPATASFDLYANYAERGADFRRIADLLR